MTTLGISEMTTVETGSAKQAQALKYVSGHPAPTTPPAACRTCLWAGCECQGMSAYQPDPQDDPAMCATWVYYD